jgi:putative sigma-54 modulation protein
MNDKILVTSHHQSVSEGTRAEIEAMAEKLLRHHAHIVRIRIDTDFATLRSGERLHTVRGMVKLRGPDVAASASTDNLYKSIHAVVDKLERMLNERTHRREDKRHHPHGVEFPVELPKTAA